MPPFKPITAEHIGSPALPLVKLGDRVSLGQKIAQTPADAVGSTYHASISGTVTDIRNHTIQISAH